MPLIDEQLTEAFRGRQLDPDRLREAGGWHDQSSNGRHYGLPARKGLWVRRIEPWQQGCQAVMLFVLVQAGAERRIKKVETMVCQAWPDGSYDELAVPFFPPDRLTAAEAVTSVVAGAAGR